MIVQVITPRVSRYLRMCKIVITDLNMRERSQIVSRHGLASNAAQNSPFSRSRLKLFTTVRSDCEEFVLAWASGVLILRPVHKSTCCMRKGPVRRERVLQLSSSRVFSRVRLFANKHDAVCFHDLGPEVRA